jgi:1-deoxy-D-xylulose-5-phosphate synthase
MISRLQPEKGIDLLIKAFQKMNGHRFQIIIMGSGNPYYEDLLSNLESEYPENLVYIPKYSFDLALEALNDAGRLSTGFTVILNDNEMSIAPNVGAMASYLTRIRSNLRYKWFKKEFAQFLRNVPLIGDWLTKKLEKLKNSFKYLLVPGVLFEELGFTYMGPVDGHDLPTLIATLNRAKQLQEPTFIHVLTRKGKGYYFSETDPAQYHGVAPFDIENGENAYNGKATSYSKALGTHLTSLGAVNPELTTITAAMPDGTGLSYFQNRFPDRFYDVGIAEQHAVTFAAGLAISGLKPVVAIYSTFLQRAYDQIAHDVCRQNLPVIFAIDRAGLVGQDGDTHHGIFDLSYLSHLPNLTIMAPKNTNELRFMLDFSLNINSPVAIRYPKESTEAAELLPSEPLSCLDWEVLHKGNEVAILAVGSMVELGLQTREILLDKGLKPTLVNARIVKPLDTGQLDKLINSGHYLLITMEENVLGGGFGSFVNDYVMKKDNSIQVINIGIPDAFIEHGSIQQLRESLHLNPAYIASQIHSLTRKETSHARLT